MGNPTNLQDILGMGGGDGGARKKPRGAAASAPPRKEPINMDDMLSMIADEGGARKKPARSAVTPTAQPRKAKAAAAKPAHPSPGRISDEDDLRISGSPESPESIMDGMRQMTNIITEATRATVAARKKATENHIRAIKKAQAESEANISAMLGSALAAVKDAAEERDELQQQSRNALNASVQAMMAELNKKLQTSKKAIDLVRGKAEAANEALEEKAAQLKAAIDAEAERAFTKLKADVRAGHADSSMPHEVYETLDKVLAAHGEVGA